MSLQTVMSQRPITATEVVRRAAGTLSYRQLDYWLRTGSIVVADAMAGSGNHRRFTETEASDIVVLAGVIHRARAAGMQVSHAVVAEIWQALGRGEVWELVLSTEEP